LNGSTPAGAESRNVTATGGRFNCNRAVNPFSSASQFGIERSSQFFRAGEQYSRSAGFGRRIKDFATEEESERRPVRAAARFRHGDRSREGGFAKPRFIWVFE
jgi:hypothetical protein